VSVLEGILVTFRGARGHPAVHPAAAARHRRRPAPAPSPCPRSTPPAEVHGQFVLHGDPLISVDPLPLGSRPRRPTACPPGHAHGRCSTVTFCWPPLPRWRLSASSRLLRSFITVSPRELLARFHRWMATSRTQPEEAKQRGRGGSLRRYLWARFAAPQASGEATRALRTPSASQADTLPQPCAAVAMASKDGRKARTCSKRSVRTVFRNPSQLE
jgi:hypothetical protein